MLLLNTICSTAEITFLNQEMRKVVEIRLSCNLTSKELHHNNMLYFSSLII
jgi:hypothetical protein